MQVCTFLPLTRHLSYDWCDLSGGPSRQGAPCKVGASCPMLDVRNYLFLVRFLHIPCIGTGLHTHSVRHFSARIYTVPCDEATDHSTFRICHAKRLSTHVSLNSKMLWVFLDHQLSALMWSWDLRGPAARHFNFLFLRLYFSWI